MPARATKTDTPPDRHLVLVGGGHAHVAVLRSLAMRPEPALRISLVSPHSHAIYSGMVPGYLAGQYSLRETQIDLRALTARARAAFFDDTAVRVDPAARTLHLERRPPLDYDLLSFDIGSRPAQQDRLAGNTNAVMVKPIEVAVSGIVGALEAEPPPGGRHIVIVGAGSGGVEIAFALAARLRRETKSSVTICDRAALPASERGTRTSRLVQKAFTEHAIDFIGGAEVAAVDGDRVELADGRTLPATLVVWATGAAGPEMFRASGLPVEERGFLRVGDDLRCVEHPEIFGAGDCVTLAGHPTLPKAGVYAVRQGPILTRNLRTAARGGTRTASYRPQRRFLSLLNTGDGRAIFSYADTAWRGALAWRLKDRIDRAFMRRYERPPLADRDGMGGEMIPCGGCAAKVGADLLARVLGRLEIPPREGVLIGLDQPDDAAVFVTPPGTVAVATTDAFPPFTDDLYLVGRVAAANAASDLYAMGAEGAAAIALVCLPEGNPRRQELQLEHVLRGALRTLESLQIPLVGGHTIAGEQALVGFSMHGFANPEHILRKSGARPGDCLVLSKALGTGVVLAAARAGFADTEWVEETHRSMLRANRAVMHILRAHAVHACTDVSGFGLMGHLAEMLGASSATAHLDATAVPALPGARELLDNGWRSSFHATNERAQANGSVGGIAPLLIDPQTSGGLLAAVPRDALAALQKACAEQNEEIYVIGEIGAPSSANPSGSVIVE